MSESTQVEDFQRERAYESRRRSRRRAIIWCSIIVVFTLVSMLIFGAHDASGAISALAA